MAGELILDTGALVSLLDRRQPLHDRFRRALEERREPPVSTEAVLTEACHLLAGLPRGRATCVEFFVAGGAILVPSTSATMRRSRELLDRYADLPMDYADATLVALAEELDTDLVLTTDRRDFSIYRIRGTKPFRILPE